MSPNPARPLAPSPPHPMIGIRRASHSLTPQRQCGARRRVALTVASVWLHDDELKPLFRSFFSAECGGVAGVACANANTRRRAPRFSYSTPRHPAPVVIFTDQSRDIQAKRMDE